MLGWLRASVGNIAEKLAGRHQTLSLVANWLANQLWLIEATFYRLAREAYGANSIVYACLRLLSQSVPEAPLRVYQKTPDGKREVIAAEHPLSQLIANPNAFMTEYELWELLTLHMGIVGRSVWWKERDNAGRVIALWPLRPDRVGPIYARSDAEDRIIVGYSYQVPGTGEFVAIAARDCVAWNFPNPAGESGGLVEGLGPLQVLAREISADNEATDFVGALLANYAAPTVALKIKDAITREADAAMIKARFRSEFSGARRGGVALLDGETDVQVIGFNLQELEFPGVRANTESRICSALGVPPSLVGVNVGLRAAAGLGGGGALAQWREYFTDTTLSNLWRRYQSRFQSDVAAEFGEGLVVEFDLSKVQALSGRRAAQLAPAESAWKTGALTRNEYRAALGYEAVDGGDVFVLPANVIEVPVVQEEAIVKAARLIVQRALRDGEIPLLGDGGDTLKKAADPRVVDEAALRVALEKLFGGFSDDMVARIRRGEGLPEDELRAELGRLLEPRLVEIAVAEGVRQGATVGVSFDLPVVNEAAVAWARGYTYDLVGGLTETTRGVVQNAVARFYETPGMTRAELEALLAPGFGPLRAEMIAITETTRAYSAAQNDYQQMLAEQGIDMERVWVTRADERVCPLCGPLHLKPEDVWKGEYPTGPPIHTRCHCSQVLRRRERVAVPAGAELRPMPEPSSIEGRALQADYTRRMKPYQEEHDKEIAAINRRFAAREIDLMEMTRLHEEAGRRIDEIADNVRTEIFQRYAPAKSSDIASAEEST